MHCNFYVAIIPGTTDRAYNQTECILFAVGRKLMDRVIVPLAAADCASFPISANNSKPGMHSISRDALEPIVSAVNSEFITPGHHDLWTIRSVAVEGVIAAGCGSNGVPEHPVTRPTFVPVLNFSERPEHGL